MDTIVFIVVGFLIGMLLIVGVVVSNNLWIIRNIFRPRGEDLSRMLDELQVEDLSSEIGRQKLYEIQGSQNAYSKAWKAFEKRKWNTL